MSCVYPKQFANGPKISDRVKEIIDEIQQPQLFFNPEKYNTKLYYYLGLYIDPNTGKAYSLNNKDVNKTEPFSNKNDCYIVSTKSGHVYFRIGNRNSRDDEYAWLVVEDDFYNYDYLVESYKLISGFPKLPSEVVYRLSKGDYDSNPNPRATLKSWVIENINSPHEKLLSCINGEESAETIFLGLTPSQVRNILSNTSYNGCVYNVFIDFNKPKGVIPFEYRSGIIQNAPDSSLPELGRFLQTTAKGLNWWVELNQKSK